MSNSCKNACLIYLFPFTVLYKWSPQHTKNHCGKQLHKASGNHSRHLTWHFPIVFFMHFKCQNFALRFAPAWTYVYISGTTHVRKDFHVYMCAWKRSQVVWLYVGGSGQISFQLECYYAFGASINVTVRKHHRGNFSKREAQADGWGTAKNRGTRGKGQRMGKAILRTAPQQLILWCCCFNSHAFEKLLFCMYKVLLHFFRVMFGSPSYCEISLAHWTMSYISLITNIWYMTTNNILIKNVKYSLANCQKKYFK